MGMFSSLGGMVGGVVGGMFGGPIGAQIGSMLGGQIGQMLEQMIGQFGQQNVAGGLANCMNQQAANVANQHVDNCGLPKFIQDEMKEFITNWMKDNMQNVPSDCQNACNDVYGKINDSQGGNNCTRTEENGGRSLDDADMNACNSTNNLDKKKGEEGKSGNWLVQLAKALAEIQTEFLNKAMDNLKTMRENKDAMDTSQEGQGGSSATGESGGNSVTNDDKDKASRGEFMAAQAEFQANFQMFNMMANMTATSLKSLGEGLTSIARKQ